MILYYESTSIYDIDKPRFNSSSESILLSYCDFVRECGIVRRCNPGESLPLVNLGFKSFDLDVPSGRIEVYENGNGMVSWGDQLVLVHPRMPFYLLTAVSFEPEYTNSVFIGGAVVYLPNTTTFPKASQN